ncbi:MAG: hypothetical protein ACKVZ0_11505 [Gemmatimonadales bacterium]
MRLALGLLVCFTTSLAGQASPYLPIDHPVSPLVEFLITRGHLVDPTPQIRPLRRLDVVRAIDSSRLDPGSPADRIAREVRLALEERPDDTWYRIEPQVGFQSFTSARRDPFHPAGEGGVRPFVEATLAARFGPLVAVSRPMAENRLKLDPDWSGGSLQRQKNQAYRFADAYFSAQFKHVRLFYGQMDRNWGPAGSLGLSIANYGYPRTDLGLDIVLRDLQLQIIGTSLTPMRSSTGVDHRRYFLAHRLNARVTKRLHLALWETTVLSGPPESTPASPYNPLVLFSFPIQLGLPDERNTTIGGDLTWRAAPGLRLEAQAMIDDRWRGKPDSVTGEVAHPGRWAFTVAGSGALGRRMAWRTSVSTISALAYRTIDSAQSFVDRGVGIGPNFTDLIRVDARVEVPVGTRWILAPELTWLRQGEGRIDAPFPAGPALTATPELLIGTVAGTVRIGASLAGRVRGVSLQGAAGWQRTTDADHIVGRRNDRFEARLQATIGTVLSGVLQ